jgi:hypothetical protein
MAMMPYTITMVSRAACVRLCSRVCRPGASN